jgi:hypothetical protein
MEHSPYLFPMFSFKKTQVNACMKSRNQGNENKLFEEEIHIMQLFYANQSIRNVRDISNATHVRPIP